MSKCNERDVSAFWPRRDVHRLRLYFIQFMQRLGKALRLRNRVIATAIVFFKRIYLKTSFAKLDPRLAAPTAVFMASKAEECGVNASKLIQSLADLGDAHMARFKLEDVLQCEFQCLRLLQFDLVVFHPYRDLVQFVADAESLNVPARQSSHA